LTPGAAALNGARRPPGLQCRQGPEPPVELQPSGAPGAHQGCSSGSGRCSPDPPVRRPRGPKRSARPRRCRTRRLALVALAVVLVGAPPVAVGAAGAAGPTGVDYDPPVDAPITDPFRPPPQPWLPGNRGIEYATAPGT